MDIHDAEGDLSYSIRMVGDRLDRLQVIPLHPPNDEWLATITTTTEYGNEQYRQGQGSTPREAIIRAAVAAYGERTPA